MADDLSKLPVALQASRPRLRIIKQNVAFSLIVKVVFLVLAISGWATLWMAVARTWTLRSLSSPTVCGRDASGAERGAL